MILRPGFAVAVIVHALATTIQHSYGERPDRHEPYLLRTVESRMPFEVWLVLMMPPTFFVPSLDGRDLARWDDTPIRRESSFYLRENPGFCRTSMVCGMFVGFIVDLREGMVWLIK